MAAAAGARAQPGPGPGLPVAFAWLVGHESRVKFLRLRSSLSASDLNFKPGLGASESEPWHHVTQQRPRAGLRRTPGPGAGPRVPVPRNATVTIGAAGDSDRL